MYEAKELPLPIDLGLAAQRESVQSLVVADVAEHRFDRREASAEQLATLIAVDLALHARGGVRVFRACVR